MSQSKVLHGRTALITGTGTGIALALAKAGADLALTARDPAELTPVVDAVARFGRPPCEPGSARRSDPRA